MPVEHRPRIGKLSPFALAEVQPKTKLNNQLLPLAICYAFAAALLLALHIHLLTLPFFWDELGQFVPTALDLARHGWLVAHSAIPNVHPPGVAAYLALWYQAFGYSIGITRVAMLLLAAAGLVITFLLAIELSRDTDRGAPAFLPPLFLLASPLLFTQSMMAQLDMPAMVLTLLALLLFLQKRFAAASLACIALALVKETGLVTPAFFAVCCLAEHKPKRAALFAMPAVALGGWLLLLHAKTGCWLGNPGFEHYNVGYALQPVRVLFSLLRRIYYLYFAEFRWIGTAALVYTFHRARELRSRPWRWTLLLAAANLVLVSVLGGAELERYLLPVLPLFYIAVSIALTHVPKRVGIAAAVSMLAGLGVNLFWNPPYPFPYENNYAMVDFVRLQQVAATLAEHNYAGQTIATAWPYSAALRNPEFGFVTRKLKVLETGDFHPPSIDRAASKGFSVLITYTRTWMPREGVIRIPLVREFLSRFYDWQSAITPAECEARGLEPVAGWSSRGQEITVYARSTTAR